MTIDLTPFYDKETPSLQYPGMATPWKSGEFVYATDGRIVVRVPAADAPDVGEPVDKVPELVEAYFDAIECAEDARWVMPPALVNCISCQNTGFTISGNCQNCGGTGECECNCGHQHKCGDCDGDGHKRKRCDDCHVQFDNRLLAGELFRKIMAISDVRMAVLDDDHLGRVYFRCNGGMGIAMPVDLAKMKKAAAES